MALKLISFIELCVIATILISEINCGTIITRSENLKADEIALQCYKCDSDRLDDVGYKCLSGDVTDGIVYDDCAEDVNCAVWLGRFYFWKQYFICGYRKIPLKINICSKSEWWFCVR